MICKTCSALVCEGTFTNKPRPTSQSSFSAQAMAFSLRHAPPGRTVNLRMFLRHQLCGELISPFSWLHLFAAMLLVHKDDLPAQQIYHNRISKRTTHTQNLLDLQ